MLLAEALMRRRDLLKFISDLTDRIVAESVCYEDELSPTVATEAPAAGKKRGAKKDGGLSREVIAGSARAKRVRAMEDELTAAMEEFEQVSVALNAANNRLAVEIPREIGLAAREMSLMEALALRKRLVEESSRWRKIGEEIGEGTSSAHGRGRYSSYEKRTRDEIRRVSVLDLTALRDRADRAARLARELDVAIQKVNWSAPVEI